MKNVIERLCFFSHRGEVPERDRIRAVSAYRHNGNLVRAAAETASALSRSR